MANGVGPRVLVVEDDYYLAEDIAGALRDASAAVMGPYGDLAEARRALDRDRPDAAVIDVDIRGETAFPLVEFLRERGVPIVLSTGVGADSIPNGFAGILRLEKPYSPKRVAEWISHAFEPSAGEPVAEARAFANALLKAIAPADMARLRPHMSLVRLRARSILQRRNQPIVRVYFPETCMCSLLAGSGDAIVEAGMIGPEGFVGSPVAAGFASAPYQVITQFEGEAIALTAQALQKALAESARLAAVFLRHQHQFQLQLVQNALALASGSVEQRLARWLLMSHDRVGDDLAVVHEFLSLMLHVRRPSVTLAMQALERAGAVVTGRGRLKIVDCGVLRRLANGGYGAVEAEQRRLLTH
jgi:CRP-like cAMP-binding protein